MKILSGIVGACDCNRAAGRAGLGPEVLLPSTVRPTKTSHPSEIAAEKEAERAYQRSLGNIPEQKSHGPLGDRRARARRRKRSQGLAGEAEGQQD